ncbi:MAG: MerR family transcriptional regulator [Chloroflexota bacterium]
MTTYSISEISRETGLSIDTLRYYERIELLVNIDRNSSGHRAYNADDLGWLNLLVCLRETGMPIADMLCFAKLIREGEHNLSERLELLQTHRQNVLDKITLMQQKLAGVEAKIEHYAMMEAGNVVG